MYSVLFVCHGNICRSPMAEFIFKNMLEKRGIADRYKVSSAATSYEEIGNDIYPDAKKTLQRHHIPFFERQARRMTPHDYTTNDLLIAMDKYNRAGIFKIIGTDPEQKVHLLLEWTGQERDIADPWYTGNFEKAFDEIVSGCEKLLARIENQS